MADENNVARVDGQPSVEHGDLPRPATSGSARISSWADALADGERQIAEAQGEIRRLTRRIYELRIAIRVCKERVEAFDSFPGESEKQ